MNRQETREPKVIRENPSQPRKARDPEAFRQLVDSVRQHGVLQPPGILPDNTNVWGWGRVLAAIEANLKEIPVIVLSSAMGQGQPSVLTLIENLVRSDLTQPEVLLGFENALRLNPAWNQKSLANNLGIQEATVSRHLAVGKNNFTREPFLAGKLNLAVAYQIATASPAAQADLLNLALSGPVTRDAIASARRVRQPSARSTVKQSRIVCPLSNGMKITVSGPEMSLTEYIEALTQAREMAAKANKESLDIKTAIKVWADKAKAGA